MKKELRCKKKKEVKFFSQYLLKSLLLTGRSRSFKSFLENNVEPFE